MLSFDPMTLNVPPQAEEESFHGKTPSDQELQEVLEATDQSLVIPERKRHPQLLLCPVGLVGAGKTPVVKSLSERLGLVRISNDEIRQRFMQKSLNYSRTSEAARSLIKKYLSEGYSVAIDADCACSTKELIDQLATNPQIKPVWIHINPPEEFILHKLRTIKYTGQWIMPSAEVALDNYFRRKPLHEHLDLPFLYTFDPSKENLAKQIDEAVRLIENIH